MPGIGSNHETKGDRDWKNAIFKIQKIKGWKALKKKQTFEDFSEVLNCGELKELLISFHSHFNSYLVRGSRFLWVPELVCILLLTRLSR